MTAYKITEDRGLFEYQQCNQLEAFPLRIDGATGGVIGENKETIVICGGVNKFNEGDFKPVP